MEKNVIALAARFADAMNADPVDHGSDIAVRDVLDWLASAGLTLDVDEEGAVAEAYLFGLQDDPEGES